MFNPKVLGQLLGVEIPEAYPGVTDCPVCKAGRKLEVINQASIVCHQCWFIGDLITLSAKVFNKTCPDTITDLVAAKALNMSVNEAAEYCSKKVFDAIFYAIIDLRRNQIDKSVNSATWNVLASLGIQTTQSAVARLSPYAFPMYQSDMDSLGVVPTKENKRVLTWWGKYGAIAVPEWVNSTPVGVWLFTVKGYQYLPFQKTHGSVGSILAKTDSKVIATDDLALALKHQIWASGSNVLFTYAAAVPEHNKHPPIYWSPKASPEHYTLALAQSALILPHTRFGVSDDYPCKGLVRQFEREVELYATSSGPEVVKLLLQNNSYLDGITISPSVRQFLMESAGPDAYKVQQILAGNQDKLVVNYNGQEVSESVDGWFINKKLITTATIQLTEVRPVGTKGEAEVKGIIKYRKQSWPFSTYLSELNKNQGDWLKQQVLLKLGIVLHVEKAWTNKLLELSQLFHEPQRLVSDQQSGWNNQQLRMAKFLVDKKGIYANSGIYGPDIPLPQPIQSYEQQAFNDISFNRLYLALLGNLIRLSQGLPAKGLLVQNSPLLAKRLAHYFRSDYLSSPDLKQLDKYETSPIPAFADFDDAGVLLKDKPYNLLTQVDERVFALSSLYDGWLKLPEIAISSLNQLRAIFLALPTCLEQGVDGASPLLYRNLAKATVAAFSLTSSVQIVQAATELDLYAQRHDGNKGSRVIELVIYGIEQGIIQPTITNEAVIVNTSQVMGLFTKSIPGPGVPAMAGILLDQGFLIGRGKGEWFISRAAWDLHSSLLASFKV